MKYFCLAWVTSYKASFFNIQIYTYTVYVCVQILRYDYTYTIVSKFRYTWIFLWCLFSASNLRGKNLRRLILKTPPNPKNASSYSPSWELMRVRVCLLQDWIICISFWFSVVKGPCARKYNLSGMLSWMTSRCKWQTNSLSHNQKETSILLPTTSSTSKHWLWGSRRCKPNAVAGDYLPGQ